jgi:methanogenic corrinoid protein MtbC1
MNIYDQLFELHDSLLNDEAWLTILETAMFDMDVEDIEELVERCIEEENESVVYDLVSEAEYILSSKEQSLDEWYNDEDEDY